MFIEVPHTGSSALHEELVGLYEGESILKKHSRLHELSSLRPALVQNGFVFAGVRSMLDVAATKYEKLLKDHKGNFTNPQKYKEHGGFVSNRTRRIRNTLVNKDANFEWFLRRYYRAVHADFTVLHMERLDATVRYEHLQEDFASVLVRLGLHRKRDLPILNPTAGKRELSEYYATDRIRRLSARIFGPHMEALGYQLPSEWNCRVPIGARVVYTVRVWVHRIIRKSE